MTTLLMVLIASQSFAAQCPKPEQIAKNIVNYWIDGLEFTFAHSKCFNKKRYPSLRTSKEKLPDTPYTTSELILIDDKRPYKLVSVEEDPSVTHVLRYKANVIYYDYKTKKPIKSSFTFDLNNNSKLDQKVYGCAFHSGLGKKYIRNSCLKKWARGFAENK